jgi:hypothetical protein
MYPSMYTAMLIRQAAVSRKFFTSYFSSIRLKKLLVRVVRWNVILAPHRLLTSGDGGRRDRRARFCQRARSPEVLSDSLVAAGRIVTLVPLTPRSARFLQPFRGLS